MDKIEDIIIDFLKKYKNNFIGKNKNKIKEDNIYNEFSLQHELGIYLRNNYPGYIVEYERNISYFINDNDKKDIKDFLKKEIDIVMYKYDGKNITDKYAIELKYPLNGQYPEQMKKFDIDIEFMKQVKKELKFNETYCLTIVNDNKFYLYKENKTYSDENTKYYEKYRTVKNKKSNEIVWEKLNDHMYYLICNK